MADLNNVQDTTALEKAAGQKAARTLSRNLKLELAGIKQTGLQLRTAGTSVNMRYDQLDSISVKATDATFKQHYGFEGIKSNGVRMHMRAYDHFGKVLGKGSVFDKLLSEIGEIRIEKVTSVIRF